MVNIVSTTGVFGPGAAAAGATYMGPNLTQYPQMADIPQEEIPLLEEDIPEEQDPEEEDNDKEDSQEDED